VVRKIIEKERPDALLPTLGGQTALNTAVALAENGTLKEFNVELIGAKLDAIKKAEDRQLFKEAMQRIGLDLPNSATVTTVADGLAFAEKQGYPLIIRPAFTLGGTGGGVCYNRSEFEEMLSKGLEASPVRQCLVEESALGWKEFEMEVMRDLADNVVIICSIETWTPWASTRVIPSRWPPSDPDRQGIPEDARTPPSRSSARSASTRALQHPIRDDPRPGAWSSSR
jgi:carbamoyl-phosphate synthase large subunit